MIPREIKEVIRRWDENFNLEKIKVPPIEKEIKEFLVKEFEQDVCNLKKEFSIDLSYWGDFN